MKKFTNILVTAILSFAFSFANAQTNIFFSEYAEGSSNNKYFEIYNPTSDTVDLSNYAYPNSNNTPSVLGVYDYWNDFDAGAVILPYDVYVVAHGSADASILAEADETHNYLSNGDDGYGLVYGDQTSYVVIDWIGDWNGDPGAGWDVAGVSSATKDHTLVRKCDVTSGNTDWTASAGTDSLNSEWTVYPQNTWTYLGSHVTCPLPPTTFISYCGEFTSGPTAWPYVLEAVNVNDGAISQGAQTFTMNVVNLPTGGATYRVAKTTANGNWFFGPAQTMVLGSNSTTVAAVTFDRTVKFQFSTGGVEYDALSVNGVATSCLPPPPPPTTSLISACDEFTAGPTAWPYVLEAVNVSAGAISQGTQTFTMNVSNLPTGGATYRVAKTTANGNWFFGPAQTMVLGSNSTTVSAVTFNRTVKFQFSSGDVEFDALTLNGVASGCVALTVPGCTDPAFDNYDATATVDDGSCANSYTLNMFDSWGDGWNGNTWTATGTSSGTVYGPYTIAYGLTGTETFSSADLCFTVICDSGSYQGEVSWDLLDGSGVTILNGGAPYSGNFGTCTYGCTDPNFDNYDSTVDFDDGSCTNTYTLLMTDSWGDGWNGNEWSATNTSTGTVYGPYTIAFGASATATFTSSDLETLCHLIVCDNGSYQSEVSWDLQDAAGVSILAGGAPYSGTLGTCISGCTNPNATNYDPNADIDDGSCIISNCNDYTLTMIDSWGDGWNGNTFDVYDASGVLVSSSTLGTGSSGTDVLCLPDACYDITCGGGSYMGEVSWTLTDDATGTVILSGGAPYGPTTLCVPPVFGCTDPAFDNYDSTATIDDGSCINTYTLYMADSWGDGWNGNTWTATSTSSGLVYGPYTIAYGAADTVTFTSSDLCFAVICDSGSYQGEVSWDLHDGSGTSILAGGAPYSGNFGTCTYGCTDPISIDYDPTADIDDGSCTYPCLDSDTTESFETNLGAWEQDATDDFNWTRDAGGTPSFATGPSTGFDGLYYMYIETSSGLPGATANLVLPCVDPTAWTEASMAFAYHMYGNTIGTLNVDASDDNGATWTNLWTLSGDQGNQWYEASINLSGYSTQIDLRIQGIKGGSFSGDIAIDLTRLQENIGGCQDTNATNYDASALIDDGSCIYLMGCTNPYADNYDSLAYLDDGSCTYTNCISVTLDMTDSWGDGWNGNTFVIADDNGYEYLNATILSGSSGTATTCLPNGICFTMTCGGGSFTNEVGWSLTDDASATVILTGGAPYSDTLCTPYTGCTDPLASNYDATALVDDGSCLYATTFTVDMNCEPAGSFGYVHLESPEFGWCGGCVPMTDPDGDGVWSVTIDLDLGNFEYKYAVDGFAGQENLIDDMQNGASCAPVTDYWSYANRLLAVAPGITTTDTYGSCDACVLGCTDPTADNYDATATTDDGSCYFTATFNVDMNCEDPSTYSTVHLESAYFGCFTGCTQMSDPEMDGIYSVTVNIPGGDFVYFYSIDNNSSREDLVDDMISGGTCAPVTDYFSYANRSVTATSGINTSDTYGSCIACVAGCTDPLANNYDSTMTTDDGSCEYDVTFTVDMSCYSGTFTTLAATGYADNWSGNTYLLSDPDGDDIWEGTYSVTNNFVYLYVVDTWADSEFNALFNLMLNGTNTCAPYTDNLSYAYRLASAPSTTADVYERCSACPPGCTDPAASNYDALASIDDGSCVYATTFNVDMNCESPGSFGYVHLESPEFGWCGGCVPLTDADGDGVWSVTIDLDLGNFEYKYAVDGWAGQEDLVDDMVNGATCAPVTDYFSYANRLVDVVAGTSTNDTYGSCDSCDQLYGCTDAGAVNYDSFANADDGSCLFSTTFNVDMNCEPAGSFGYVHLESPAFGWCGGCVPMSDPDGDGIHSVTVDLPAGNFEYKYAVDGWAGQEDLVDDMVGGASCAPVTDYFSYANRLIDINGSSTTGGEIIINGNFESGTQNWVLGSAWAVINNAADCWYQGGSNGGFPDIGEILQYTSMVSGKSYRLTFDATINSGSFEVYNGYDQLFTVDSTSSYSFDFVSQNVVLRFSATGSFGDFQLDNVSITELEYNSAPNLHDTYSSCTECILGCTDSLAFNYSDSAMVDDGSCLYGYNCPAPYPIGLSSSDIYAEMATVHWADANSGSCRVWKYFVRYRPVGDSVWTTKAAGIGSGLCNVGLPNTSKVLRGLLPSTTYEFKMKAFYCGGGESNYSYTDQFTTLPACPPMTNLAVQTFGSNHGKAKFTWNETGPYTFARIALRVNTPGSSWQTAGGFGVNYPQFSVLKFGLTGGTEYRAQGRTFCDPVVTSYRSTWTAPIVWTQPGVAPIRLDGGTAINNLEVYPNPSKDIFNVSFVSEDMQNLEIRVLNLIGEVIYTEGLDQFIGEYTKSINLSKYTKGVYFLEITTKEGVVNKKIVLQ